MSPHLKAFIIVFAVSVFALFLYRAPIAGVVGAKRADNWRNMWLAATAALFLIPNFWAFIITLIVLVAIMARTEPLKPAAFLMLLFFAPAYGDSIPGFAGINKFIMVTPPVALIIALLIPLLASGRAMKKIAPAGGGADLFMLLYILLLLFLSTRAESFTHMLRTAIERTITVAPLYYAFSRAPKSLDDIRVLSAAFVYPVLILCVISIPEFLKNWHLYTSASDQWFGARSFTYVLRDGFLRTSTSINDPIAWGAVCMAALGVGIALISDKFSRPYRYLSFGLLAFGLIVSFSRGPWLGAFIAVGVFILVSPRAMQRFVQIGAGGTIALLFSMATPVGRRIIDLIPFIGDAATDTISYRRQLLTAARQVMAENPILGSENYMHHPKLEALRQGQGIIDIVNSYLQIGLESGYVGLALFTGFFGFALLALYRAIQSSKHYDPEMSLYCRAYFGALIGLLATIFTTSSVLHIPYLYWTLGGIAVALARIERHRRENAGALTATAPAAAAPAQTDLRFNWK
ncbi:MAG: O-antigen ligase family protein [Parvularculaceae bacterium]